MRLPFLFTIILLSLISGPAGLAQSDTSPAVGRGEIADYRESRSPRNLLLGALYALGTTLILAVLLVLFKFIFRKAYGFIEAWGETKIKALQIQELEVVSAELPSWPEFTATCTRISRTPVFEVNKFEEIFSGNLL